MNTVLRYRLRTNPPLTQRALAQKAGLSKTTVNSVENGKNEPSVTTINALARALDVDPVALHQELATEVEPA